MTQLMTSTSSDLLLDIDFSGLCDNQPTSDGQIIPIYNAYSGNGLATVPDDLWFVANDSWDTIHVAPGQGLEHIDEESLNVYVATVQTWFRQWTKGNNCPLIHRQLYRMQMPRYIQDAFTILSTYLNKTSSTQKIIFHIIEERANDVVQQNTTRPSGDMTLIEHLARVQALLIYQIIRLFDGDIRLRACAEAHAPTLATWNALLWQKTTAEMTAGNFAALSLSPLTRPTSWKAWCVVESIRRTWLTTGILQSVYATVKDGLAACPGGVMCTFGNGLWDAENEFEWDARVHGRNKLFMQSMVVGNLLEEESPSRVDEFGHAIVLISHGLEKKQRWIAKNSV